MVLVARLLLIAVAALWGLTFVANHELLVSLDALQITVLRFVGVSAVFGVMLLVRPDLRPRFSRRAWGVIAVSAVLAVPGAQLSVVHGQNFLAPALTSMVVATAPVVVAIMSVLFLGEVLRLRQALGFALALGGAAIVIVLASGEGTALTVRNPWGASLTIVAQISWALYTVLSKPFAARQHPLTAVSTVVIAGTILLLPLFPHALAGVAQVNGWQWLWLAHLVVGGTVVPYLIYFSSLRVLEANKTGAYLYLIPFFGILWSSLILKERLAPVGLLGGAIIVLGVVLTQIRPAGAVPSEVLPVAPAEPGGEDAPRPP